MYRKLTAFIALCFVLVLSSCSPSAGYSRANGLNGAMQSTTDVATDVSLEILLESQNQEIEQLQSELQVLAEAYEEAIASADQATSQVSSQLEARESELASLQAEYEQIESDRADLAKAYQQYKNEVEQFIMAEQDASSTQITSDSSVDPYLAVNYEQLMSDSNNYYMRHVSVSGTVRDIDERNEITQVLLAYDGQKEQLILLEFTKSILTRDFLEIGDQIKVYGTSFGLLEVRDPDGLDAQASGLYVDLFMPVG